jgi:hypothetical protein
MRAVTSSSMLQKTRPPTAVDESIIMTIELFELEMFGEGVERRYRKMRPEVARMPWGSLDITHWSEETLFAARKAWTAAAFQEHRTGVACCMTLRAMMEARAPVDLIAVASRFPQDEMVHVELCARMAMELGGGVSLRHDPMDMVVEASNDLSPLLRAAEMATRFFCVGEALSIPLLRGTWHAAKQPLPKAVLGRIVRDEAAHGSFGFTFLDWALGKMSERDLAHVGAAADRAIRFLQGQWATLRTSPRSGFDDSGDTLGWMRSDAYLAIADNALERKVRIPLRERDIPISA